MRISELADAAGVPLPTVKYYLREGLLPPGRTVTSRLSEYDREHLRRLRLLRVLREVGHVPVSRLRVLAEAVERGREPLDLMGLTADALAPAPPAAGEGRPAARAQADAVVEQAGWQVRSEAADRDGLAAVLEALAAFLGGPVPPSALSPYVDTADRLARHEIASLDPDHGSAALLQQMVVGQVLFGRLLDVLRRLAEEHHSTLRFGTPERHG